MIFHCDCFRERASHLEVELEKAKTDFRNLQAHQDIEVAVHDAIMKVQCAGLSLNRLLIFQSLVLVLFLFVCRLHGIDC